MFHWLKDCIVVLISSSYSPAACSPPSPPSYSQERNNCFGPQVQLCCIGVEDNCSSNVVLLLLVLILLHLHRILILIHWK